MSMYTSQMKHTESGSPANQVWKAGILTIRLPKRKWGHFSNFSSAANILLNLYCPIAYPLDDLCEFSIMIKDFEAECTLSLT
jgi:hypothetical protein